MYFFCLSFPSDSIRAHKVKLHSIVLVVPYISVLISRVSVVSLGQGVDYLYKQHSAYLIKQCIENYEVDSTFSATTNTEHILLHRLILAPRSVVYNTSSSNNNTANGVYSSEVLAKLVDFLCTVHTQGKLVTLLCGSVCNFNCLCLMII